MAIDITKRPRWYNGQEVDQGDMNQDDVYFLNRINNLAYDLYRNGIISTTGIILGFTITILIFSLTQNIIDYNKYIYRIYFIILFCILPFTLMWLAYGVFFQSGYNNAIKISMAGLSVSIGLIFDTFYTITSQYN